MCKDPDLTFRVVPAISWDPEEPERAQPGHDGQWQAVAGGDGAGTEGVGQARCIETYNMMQSCIYSLKSHCQAV